MSTFQELEARMDAIEEAWKAGRERHEKQMREVLKMIPKKSRIIRWKDKP